MGFSEKQEIHDDPDLPGNRQDEISQAPSEVYDDNDFEERDPELILHLVYAALFAALIAAGAYIRIALPFVPITLQTFFVIMAAVLLGRKWGTVSVVVYLLVGLIGLPVFSGGTGGTGVLLGPTGGYLYSFVIVSFIVGFLSDRVIRPNAGKYSKLRFSLMTFFIAVAGSLLILLIGTIHLMYVTDLPFRMAFYAGFLPFVPGEILKSLVVVPTAGSLFMKTGKQKNV
ncbi:biotin transporter BioY [Methanosarcinaceae archaeon]|nr:biotin transporter BioY [Methanosarcinaceae archaeon]MBQ3620468.1 biotin transporter BioY [Methanosarcinaceae archaeon]